jgi:hypothetical protein
VEAERRQLPAQLLDIPVRDALQAIGDEGPVDLLELGLELARQGIAARRRRVAGQPLPGPPEAFGHEPEAASIRLAREAARELPLEIGEAFGIAGQALRDRRAGHQRRRDRDRLHEPHRHGLVAPQDMVGLDPQRREGRRRGDGRVAVAIAADPGAELQERPGSGWPGAGPTAVGGGPRGGDKRVQGGVEGPVQPRDHPEQGRVEEGHRAADLVERARADDPGVGRAPQDRHLLAQPATDLAVLARRQARVVEPLQQIRGPAQGDKDGAAPGLGRVGREDRLDLQPSDERGETRRSAGPAAQERNRLGDRIVEGAVARRSRPATQHPHPMTLLGEVHEPEVEPERLDEALGLGNLQGVELRREAGPLRGIVGAAQPDEPATNTLHELEQVRARLLRDHLAEERAEQADLVTELVAGAGGADPLRLGAHGAVDHRGSLSGAGRQPGLTRR